MTPYYPVPHETEIEDIHGDVIGTVFHHGDEVQLCFYRPHFTLDHAGMSKLAAAGLAY
jgi:hypothetical protein